MGLLQGYLKRLHETLEIYGNPAAEKAGFCGKNRHIPSIFQQDFQHTLGLR